MRAVRPFLFWGFARPLATPAGLPSVGQPDAYGAGESRVPQRQRVSPRAAAPLCENCPRIRPNKAVGAAARRFGSAFAFFNGSTTTNSRAEGRVR